MSKPGNSERGKILLCDEIIERAARMIVDEIGACSTVMIDRMLTYAAAQACVQSGSPATARAFRTMADNIDAGCFHSVTGEKHAPSSDLPKPH